MFIGTTPFIDQTEYLIFQNIKKGIINLPKVFKQNVFCIYI